MAQEPANGEREPPQSRQLMTGMFRDRESAERAYNALAGNTSTVRRPGTEPPDEPLSRPLDTELGVPWGWRAHQHRERPSGGQS
jgi:hypothetical protein